MCVYVSVYVASWLRGQGGEGDEGVKHTGPVRLYLPAKLAETTFTLSTVRNKGEIATGEGKRGSPFAQGPVLADESTATVQQNG